jgi:ABC-type lipoprotein release transport system permease subunit
LGYEAAELEQREVGDMMLVGQQEFEVVGILGRTGTQDDGLVYLPLKVLQQTFEEEGKLTMLGIKLRPDADANAFEEELYKLPDVQVVSMIQVKNTIMSLVTSARAIVLSIAFIAFVIALFGVLNTVLMSVLERYQEIGILKSIGALPSDIFIMILFETFLLCILGGITGIIFAFLISKGSELVIRYFLPFAPSGNLIILDFHILTVALIAISLTGIISGIYPAFKAATIRPLEAIRSEI